MIKTRLTKWRIVSGSLDDCGIPIKFKGKFYKIIMLHVILHGNECWTVKKHYVHKISVVEIMKFI